MKTKNTEGAEALNKNVKNMLKLFQDTSLEIMETQTKQLKVANEMFSKALNNYFDEIKKSDFNESFNVSKEMMETMQKNTKDFMSKYNDASKKIMEFGQSKKADSYLNDFLSKITETFNKQIVDLTTVNKNYFNSLNSSTTFSPLLDKLKTEFDTNFKSSKKTMQDIVDSYSQLKTPTTEANKKVLDDLNKNMTTMAENNLKLWSELISNTNKPDSKNDDETSSNKPSFHSNGKATIPKTI